MRSDRDALVGPMRPEFESSRWRNRQHLIFIGAHDLPAALVHHPVMPITEKGEVRKVARPVLDPVDQVMAFGHAHGPIASWPRTSAIANFERLALRS